MHKKLYVLMYDDGSLLAMNRDGHVYKHDESDPFNQVLFIKHIEAAKAMAQQYDVVIKELHYEIKDLEHGASVL